MSNITIMPSNLPEDNRPEEMRVRPNGFSGFLRSYVGKQGGFYVGIIPSLMVSGYGATEEEARDDLEYNLKLFFDDMHALSEPERRLEILKLGWKQKGLFRKNLVPKGDFEDVRSDFDDPESVKSFLLQAA